MPDGNVKKKPHFRDHKYNPQVISCTFNDLVNIKGRNGKRAPMAGNPCDTCMKDCVGGIIYGNCQQFLHWRREINKIVVCVDSLINPKRTGHFHEI
ncbi:MAG TPA: hypothetical protein VFC43_07435 [Methanoregula sp.]|nr:hypothetical protein [Methanoregula sp.]